MFEFGAFLDAYYAYDFNRPEVKRVYTTQPVRHAQPAINLAHVEMKIQTENLRSRVAMQAGDSVERNAYLEPGVEKYIQESYIGTKLGEETWLDAGIFLGNIGAESWISKNNWTYSRALNLDYVPYYSSGFRFDHQVDQKQNFQLQILNGWQNISENNHAKAIGMQYKNLLSDSLIFTYNNFFGNEEIVSENPRFRTYHNFIFEWRPSEIWQYLYVFDVGTQAQQNNDGIDPWYTTTLTARRILSTHQALAFRVEYYNDRHQANVTTGSPNGFQVGGASINYDQSLTRSVLWRSEVRGFYSMDEIYPQKDHGKNRMDEFIVTSISIWI